MHACPYATKEECEKARDNMAQFGAICSEPIEVSDDYELYKLYKGE